ncbi:RHS repeat domain-containing protein [Vibrio sp. TRT 1302]|uniref:RHS repeat domain-containing protein n=1 Tax=Vibrio sp. TRT 1302 TaxID=3418504 RepID=UPI003CEF519D
MSFDAEPDTTSDGNKGNNGRGKGKGQSSTSSVTQSGVIILYSHYDGRQEQGQWQHAGHGFEVFRSLTLLPQANLPYAQVLYQSLSDSKSQLVKASGTKGADASNLYVHHDHLGSAIQVLDDTGTQAMRLGYSPFGQVYRKHNDKTQWKINAGVNANKQLGQLMPYQYTGGYTDGNTGLVHFDARWYNPHTSRFVQPDYWNLKNTYLPSEIQHELMRYTGLNASQLLRDPSQQLAFGYVSGNPLSWVDPFGLCIPEGATSQFARDEYEIQYTVNEIEKNLSYNMNEGSFVDSIKSKIRVGYIINFSIENVFSATIDLGSVRLSDKIGSEWTQNGRIDTYSEGRTKVELGVPLLGSASVTNKTKDNGETWEYRELELNKGLLPEVITSGELEGSTFDISFGISIVYEDTITVK